MKRFLAAVVVAITLAPTIADAQQFVRIGSGLAGTYPVYGAKLAEVLNKEIPGIRASTLSGPTEQTLIKVQKGEAEMSLTYTFQGFQVANGQGALGFPTPDLRHLMSLYGSYHVAVARRDSAIASLADVTAKPYKVWLGTKAGVFWPLNTAALAAHGVTPEAITKAGGVINTMGYQNVAQAFQDGQIDIAFFSGPSPYSLLMQLDRAPGFKILNFDKAAADKYVELIPGNGIAVIKGGTYASTPNDVTVPYVFNQMVVSAKLSDDLVYRITKVMNETTKQFQGLFPGVEEINSKTALIHNKLPIHPGAARYYREHGLLK